MQVFRIQLISKDDRLLPVSTQLHPSQQTALKLSTTETVTTVTLCRFRHFRQGLSSVFCSCHSTAINSAVSFRGK